MLLFLQLSTGRFLGFVYQKKDDVEMEIMFLPGQMFRDGQDGLSTSKYNIGIA